MTDEQLRLKFSAAIGRHSSNPGASPALLDELVKITREQEQAALKAAVLAQVQPPVLVAASDAVPDQGAPRTRTRTRGGKPA